MNFSIQNDMNKRYLEYIIQDNDIVDTFSENMIKNNTIPGIVPMLYQQMNNKRLFIYDISNEIALDEFIKKPLNGKQVINIFISIIDIFTNNSGYMIEDYYYILDEKYIYVDNSQCINMICLPLENFNNSMKLDKFIKNILTDINYIPNESNDYVTKIINYLNMNRSYTLNGLRAFLETLLQEYNNNQGKPIRQVERVEKCEKNVLQTTTNIEEVPTPKIKRELPKDPIRKVSPSELVQSKIEIENKKEEPSKSDDLTESKGKKQLFSLFNTKEKKEKKPIKRDKGNIPSKGGRSSIPTKHRESAEVNKKPDYEKKNMDKYDGGVKIGEFGETVDLSTFNQTTLLPKGTVALDDINSTITYPTLTRKKTNKSVLVDREVFNIGKDPESNHFVIDDNETISRKHASISYRNGTYYITDLDSLNKTVVDNVLVKPGVQVELQSGSIIKLSNEIFIFEL